MLPLRQRLDALHRACSVRYERQGREAVIDGSSWAHAAGGRIPGIRIQLAPGSRRGLIQFLEIPVADVNLSRTSIRSGGTVPPESSAETDSTGMDRGIEKIVRTLLVMFSPSAPSPRVAPSTSLPLS